VEKIILFVHREEEPDPAKKSPFPATNSLFPASQNGKTVTIDMQMGKRENSPGNEERFFLV